ncbi:MAG: hypothetical protein HC913_13210 [Microscillaceae bacterium]|nr:hypothetical protein [Microscillaceae bacterium]
MFSHLHVPQRHIAPGSDRMEIRCPQVSMQIAFYLDPAAEVFVRGLFQDQAFRLGDRYSQVDLRVAQVALLPLPDLGPGLVFLRPISPLVVARKDVRGIDQYLDPAHPDFGELLLENLVAKYLAVCQETGQPVDPQAQESPLHYALPPGQKPKARLITLKADTAQATRVKGYVQFVFCLQAPPVLVALGLQAGFGKLNAQGFGMVEVVEGKKLGDVLGE